MRVQSQVDCSRAAFNATTNVPATANTKISEYAATPNATISTKYAKSNASNEVPC